MHALGAEFTMDKEFTKAVGVDIDHGDDRSIKISQGSYICASILERLGFEKITQQLMQFVKKTYQKLA